jgi:hypothetical protein
MKPFANTGILTSEQQHFNYRLSRAMIVVENAFGRLKQGGDVFRRGMTCP